MVSNDTVRLDFVCVHNAGRSQMAAAFAEREREERGLEDLIEVHSGGTEPAEEVHPEVVDVMAEVGIDLTGRTPDYVDLEHLRDSQYLVTMGCSIREFNPASYGVESREWDLPNPKDEDMETVREVRDETERRIRTLFDEIETVVAREDAEEPLSKRFTAALKQRLSF